MPGTAASDDVGSDTTISQPPSTSQCESTPRLAPGPREASIVRGDPREDAPEPEAAYELDEVENESVPGEMENASEPGGTDGANDPGETEGPARNLDEQFSIVSDGSSVEEPRRLHDLQQILQVDINIVHDSDYDDEYNVMKSNAENDDGASGDNDSDSEGELDDRTDDSQEEEGEEEAKDPLLYSSLIDALGGMSSIASGTISADYLKSMATLREEYPVLFQGEYGPTASALDAASSDNTNNKTREKKTPGYTSSSREATTSALGQTPNITARELCVFIARAISPGQRKLENHWKPTDEEAIPRGRLGLFMTRDRFMHISQNLHFRSNSDFCAANNHLGSFAR
ncbi:hypothetical protein GQ600_24155 [Phytophthora cactorum]|nr:hypothetical protein GQ600_24155 [Phytophthora cactorum]